MPLLSQTIILPNNPSTLAHLDAIKEYLQKELNAGRMSGPFSREETELILHGPFQSSPLIISVQPQQPGTPDKLRICQHLSNSTKVQPSVNSYIHKEDFPTRFDLASKIADMVSLLFNLFPITFYSLFMHPFVFRAWGCFSFIAMRNLGICITDALSGLFVLVAVR